MSSKPPHFHRMWGKNSLNKIHYCICNRRLCIAGKCHAHNNYKLLLKGLVWNIENTLFLMARKCLRHANGDFLQAVVDTSFLCSQRFSYFAAPSYNNCKALSEEQDLIFLDFDLVFSCFFIGCTMSSSGYGLFGILQFLSLSGEMYFADNTHKNTF
jgi:hypothetical protein